MLKGCFMRWGIIPGLSFKHTINVFTSQDGDKVGGLLDLDAVVVIYKPHVGKRRLVFSRQHEGLSNNVIDGLSNVFVRACEGKVVNLAKKQNFDNTKRSRVDWSIRWKTKEIMRSYECLRLLNHRWRNQQRSNAKLSKIPLFDDPFSRTDNRHWRSRHCISTVLMKQSKTKVWAQ